MKKSARWIVILTVFCVFAGATASATESLPGPVKRRMQQYKHIKTGLWMNVFTDLDIYYEGDATSNRYKYGTLTPGRKVEILRWNDNMTMVRLDNGQIAFVRRKIIDPKKQRTRAQTFTANKTTPPRPGEKPAVSNNAQRPTPPSEIPLPVPRPEIEAPNNPSPQVEVPLPVPRPETEASNAPTPLPPIEVEAPAPVAPAANLPRPVKERMEKYKNVSTGLWMDVVSDLDIYSEGDGTSERYKYGTLKPGRKFEVLRWNDHMTMIRLDDGQIAYVRRKMIDPKKEGAKNWKERAEQYADLLKKGNGQESAQAPVPPLPTRRPEPPAEKPVENPSVSGNTISLPGTIVTNEPLDPSRLEQVQAQDQANLINQLSPATNEICTTCANDSRKLQEPASTAADPASVSSMSEPPSAQPAGSASDFLNALSCESLDNEKFQCYRDNIHRLNEYYANRRGGFGSTLYLGGTKPATKMLGQCYKYVKMADNGPGKRCGFAKDYADLSAKNAKYTLPKMTGMIDLFELNDKNPYLNKLLKENNLPPVDQAFAKEIVRLLSNKSKAEIRPIGGVQILKPTRYRANGDGGDKHGHIEVKTSVYTYASDGRRASPGDVWIGNRTLYGYMMRPEVFLNAYRSYIHGKLPGGKAQCAAKIRENTGFHMTASSYRSKPVNRSRTAGGRL